MSDIKVPEEFIGNGNVYHPDGYLFGFQKKNQFYKICRAHDYLYSTLSDEDYSEITKVQADLMLKQEIQKMGLPEHAEAFHRVLNEIGSYYYKKRPQGDIKKTIVFETAMGRVDEENRPKYRTIDCALICSGIIISVCVISGILKWHKS